MKGCSLVRVFDIILASLTLIILLPFLAPVIILLRFTGEGEVFYVQKRVGSMGRQFGLLKFATMLKDSPNMSSGDITIQNDPRVLPVGRFLRATKINELPQLINVAVGDMSLIGPRPLTKKMFLMYSSRTQSILSQVRPGLSGVGSIVFRDEQSYLLDDIDPMKFYVDAIAPFKGLLEEWYVVNRSVFLYFSLILLTTYVIFTKDPKIMWRLFSTLPRSKKLSLPYE